MPDHIELARIEVLLMREYLSPPGERPALNQCIWVESLDTDTPPPRRSVLRLQEIIAHYGACNVTTGTGTRPEKIGVYVRGDVLEKSENPLWTYLHKHD